MEIVYDQIKARDLNLTLVTFWILLAVKCPPENYSKPYGRATAMPPACELILLGKIWMMDDVGKELRNFPIVDYLACII